MATDVANLAMNISVNGAQRARQALQGINSDSIRLTRATEEQIRMQYRLQSSFVASGKAASKSSRNYRQTAMQLSQIAQQGAATGNYLQALAIQLPDLALGLGPIGIVAGAAAGALASFVFSAKDASANSKLLIDRVGELEVSYKDLNDEIREALRLEQAREESRIARQIAEEERQLRLAQSTLNAYNRSLNMTGAAAARFQGLISEDKVREATETVTEQKGELSLLELQLKSIQEEYRKYINGTGEAEEAINKANESTSELNQELRFQVETYGESERAIALAKIAQLEKNGADAEAIKMARNLTNALYDKKEAEQAATEAERARLQAERQMQQDMAQLDPAGTEFNRYADQIDRIEEYNISAAEKDRLREEAFRQHQERMASIAGEGGATISDAQSRGLEILNDSQMKSLDLTGQFFGNLASIAEKGGKEAFQRYQNLASAQASIAAALSIASVIGDPTVPAFLKVPLAFSIGGIAAAQVATIQGQEYQGSYLGGGYTGDGARTGGIDGKGGFPAILHPNETVIDHTMGKRAGGGQPLKLTVITNTSRDMEVEERVISENEREVIITEAVRRVDRNLSNANSSTARALSRNTTAKRAR